MKNLFLFSWMVAMALTSVPSSAFAQIQTDDNRCHIDGYSAWATCGALDVPLDWNGDVDGRLTLAYSIIAAKNDQGLPPLFALAGGPGQAITETGPMLSVMLEKVNRTRDLVLLDQRGTGRSHPMPCPQPETLDFDMSDAAIIKQTKECLAAQTENPIYFNSSQAVKDLDAMRKHLGMDKIALWGGSYGTRMALLYMKDYPQHVDAAVLDGVAPAHRSFLKSSARFAHAALERLFDDCAANTMCNTAYPNLRATFKKLQSNTHVATEQIEMKDPISGDMLHMVPTPSLVTQVVRGILYSTAGSAYLPYAITEASKGNYSPLSALSSQPQHTEKQMMYMGMTLSTICPEDVMRANSDDVAKAGEGTFGRDYFYRQFKISCDNWVYGTSPGTDQDPLNSDIPLLLLSGDVDPITAPEMAESILDRFSNAKHFIAANNGHIVSATRCGAGVMERFYLDKKPDELDGSCFNDIKRPPFYISSNSKGEAQ